MPILLTTPLEHNPGHGHELEIYSYVMIVEFRPRILESTLTIDTVYGNVVDGQWVTGCAAGHRYVVRNTVVVPNMDDPEGEPLVPANPAYNTMVGATLVDGEDTGARLYDIVARSLYQHLLDNGLYEGTIV